MNRKLAREEAYKLVFGYLFTKEVDNASLEGIRQDEQFDENDIAYILRTYHDVIDNFEDISATVAKYAKDFTLERIFKPDLAGLMVAIAEMKYNKDIPLKVSITEMVDIVKKYSVAKSQSFVNGVLASVYRELTDKESV